MGNQNTNRAAVLDEISPRILIVDDHDGTRRATRMLLESRDNWVVCGEAADGNEAVASALRLRPDVIVMDVAMPRMNGLQAAERLSEVLPGTPVLLFTLSASQHLMDEQKNAISGIVSKQNAAADLPKAVDAVLHGGKYFAPDNPMAPTH